MNDNSLVEEFYQTVAQMLGYETHSYQPFLHGRRTRWNNRLPGNGRFVGHGLVRYFGPTHVQVQLTHPPVSGLFSSPSAALIAISVAIQETSEYSARLG